MEHTRLLLEHFLWLPRGQRPLIRVTQSERTIHFDPFPFSVSPLCCSVCSLFNSSLCLHSIYATPTDTARPRPLIYYSFNWPPKAPSLDVKFEPNSWFFPQQVFRPSASLAFAINMQILSLFKNN